MDDFNKTPNIYPNLNVIPLNANISNEQQQFRLIKINEIKDYFLAEIKERELISKNISKYIASLDYFDKSLNFYLYYQEAFLLHHFQLLLEHLQEQLEQVVVLRFQLHQDL